MEKLTNVDIDKYLKSGELSQPFIDSKLLKEKVDIDYYNRLKLKGNANQLESLYFWIHKNLESADDEFRKKYKFNRNAGEIWESGKATGCTDYALVFATLARQLGIPTTLLHTSEKTFLFKLINNESFSMRSGHSFCECFYDGKWILVDPTKKEIVGEYNPDIIELPYSLGGEGLNKYIPYYRGLDLGKKMTLREHGDFEEDCIAKINFDSMIK